MKTLKLIVIGLTLILAGTMNAQVSVSVNLGVPPPWGPVGYTTVRYYYLPDVEAYYDVQSAMFIYYGGGVWVHKTYLPERYKSYDLYGGYKVVMTDYHGNTPYTHFKEHKMKYAKGYHGKAQRTIGERPGKGNSDAKNYHKSNHNSKEGGGGNGKNDGHDNNKGDSHGKDKNKNEGHGGDNGKKK